MKKMVESEVEKKLYSPGWWRPAATAWTAKHLQVDDVDHPGAPDDVGHGQPLHWWWPRDESMIKVKYVFQY